VMAKRVFVSALVLAGVLSLAGCDKNPLGTIDPRGSAPSVLQFSVSPPSLRLDTLAYSGGSYSATLKFSALLASSANSASIVARVIAPDGTEFGNVGLSPTTPAGMYTGTLNLKFSKSSVGSYTITLDVNGEKGFQGTSAIRSFAVTRNVSPPWLYNLHMPDTITIPRGAGTAFGITVAANDSAGLSNISSVLLNIPEGNNPNGFLQLLDNGLAANGDAVADDGIYSIVLAVNDSPTVRKKYTFRFMAVNRNGDTSAVIIHPLVMQ